MPLVAPHRLRSLVIKFLRIFVACISIYLLSPQLSAVDLFDSAEDKKNEPVQKTWSRDEINDLKSSLKDDFKRFAKARDFWSLLQLEAWVKSLDLDIKFSTPLGKSVIGNPLYAFPHGVRNVFDHGDWVGVQSNDRVHFIDGEGRPIKPSIHVGHYAGQTAMTANGKYYGGMQLRIEGEAPNLSFYFRTTIANLESGTLQQTNWADIGRPIRDGYERATTMAHDGSAVAFRFRAPMRQQDFVIVIRPGRSHIYHDKLRTVRGVGEQGRWLIARHAVNNRWQFLIGDKRDDIRNGVARDSFGAILSMNGKKLEFIQPDGQRKTLKVKTSTATTMWALDKYLVVRLGQVEEKMPDRVDLFGKVIEKGKTISVYKTVLFSWKDLMAGKLEPKTEIIGNIVENSQRPDAFFTYSANKIELHDLSKDPYTKTAFATLDKNIEQIQVRNNGIRIVCTDWHNKMLNYHGKVIWEGGPGYIEMIHPMTMVYVQEETVKKVKKFKYKIVNFYENGDTHTVDVPGTNNENEYDIGIHYHRHYGRRYNNSRNWLYFNLESGALLKDGHVADNADPIPRWGLPTWSDRHGRFNVFGSRLIPKWIYQKQASADRFYARDAMYTRGGLMVITKDDQLLKFNKDMELKDHLTDAQLNYGHFAIQDKDLNTYITSWIDGRSAAKYYIDATGKFRSIKTPGPITAQDPEGEWKIEGRSLYIPRKGTTYWPAELVGFFPARIRSRKGARDLLVICNSLVIELDSTTIKKLLSK